MCQYSCGTQQDHLLSTNGEPYYKATYVNWLKQTMQNLVWPSHSVFSCVHSPLVISVCMPLSLWRGQTPHGGPQLTNRRRSSSTLSCLSPYRRRLHAHTRLYYVWMMYIYVFCQRACVLYADTTGCLPHVYCQGVCMLYAGIYPLSAPCILPRGMYFV